MDRIEALAASTSGEDQRFEFKSASAIRAPGDAGRIAQAVCAFANTRGGFIVFGVDERPNKSGWNCRPGPINTEAPKLINDKVHVDPMPTFPTPVPILKGDKAYYVLHIPASPYAAHSAGGIYYHRTLSGNESMPPEMLRERILGQAQRKGLVKVLLQELNEVFIEARSYLPAAGAVHEPNLVPLDLSTILRVRSELLLAMSADADAVESLRLFLVAARRFNALVTQASLQLAATTLPRVRGDWNDTLARQGKTVCEAVNRASLAVGRVFGEAVANRAQSLTI